MNCFVRRITIENKKDTHILDALPVLIAALPEVIMGIVNFLLDSIPQIIETGIKLLTSLIDALPQIIATIVEAIPKIINGIINAVLGAIPQIIQAGIQLLISLIQALPQIITTIVSAIPQIISGIVNAVIGNIPQIINAGVQLFVSLIKNLPTIIVEIVKAVPQIVTGIVNAFGSLMGQIVEIGGNIVKGLWQGIQQLASWLWDKVSGWISSMFTVSFSCLPFKYLDSGQETVTITNSGTTLTNPTAFATKPLICVYGSGEGRITIQSSAGSQRWDLSDISSYIAIDSEQMNCYKDAEPKNDCVDGNGFPLLHPGANKIIFAGDIRSVTVLPRWVTL